MRRSIVKKKNKKPHNEDANAYWTSGEKMKLLKALKHYGVSKSSKFCEQISKEIGTKNAVQVAHYLNRRRLICDNNEDNKKTAPIDEWLDKAKKGMAREMDFSNVLGEVFNECTQDNFKEIYMFLSSLLKNEYPPDMSSISATILVKLMTDLADLIQQVGIHEIKDTFSKYFPRNNESPESSPEQATTSDPNISFYRKGFVDDGCDLSSLNPLNFPPEFLEEINAKTSKAFANRQ